MKFAINMFALTLLPVGAIAQAGEESVARKSQLTTVEQCDLIRDPALYDGKQIRVRGFYMVAGSSVSQFFNSSCDDKVVWVEFNADYQSCSSSTVVKSLVDMQRNSGFRWSRPHVSVVTGEFRSAEVEFVGRFSASNPYKPLPSSENDGPLGRILTTRQNADFVLSVSCVERAKPLPKRAVY